MNYFSLFSPAFEFRALFARHCAIFGEAVTLLQSVCADYAEASAKCQRIQALAVEGNANTHEIDRQLSLTLIKPLDRQGICDLNRAFEEALKAVKAVAVRIRLYGLKEPRSAAKDLASILREIADEIERLLSQLETKGTGEESRANIRRLRHEADMLLLVAMGELYEAGPIDPAQLLDLIKWAQLFDRIEEAIDRAGTIAEVVENILLRNV